MKAAVCRITAKSGLSAVTILMIAVAVLILVSPAVEQAASLQEAAERRAVADTFHWPPIGPFWGFLFVQIPLWLSLGAFLAGVELGERKPPVSKAAVSLCVTCWIVAALGVALFLMTREKYAGICGPALYRYVPIMVSAFLSGMLSCAREVSERWAGIVPPFLAFFIVFLVLSSSTPELL